MPYTAAALAMLVLWGAGVLLHAPGWIHILLSGGVALWIYGVVKPKAAAPKQ